MHVTGARAGGMFKMDLEGTLQIGEQKRSSFWTMERILALHLLF